MSAATETVRSSDGTMIAYQRSGEGRPLILVDGALCSRKMGPSAAVAAQLAKRFSVVIYDRRGRGESGDTAPYAVEREVEDLHALIAAVGGSALVCGFSSGAALALEAASRGASIEKLALYEAPFIVDDSRPPLLDDYRAQLEDALANGRRGDVVKLFMKAVQVPDAMVWIMRLMPAWSKMKTVAHTILYDTSIVEAHQRGKPLPVDRWSGATMPTLVIDGSKSPEWMRNAMRQLAGVLPNAAHRTLAGQTHMVNAKVLAPVLIEVFESPQRSVA